MGYERKTLELLGRVAEEHDLLIAADEIYTTYLYEGEFIPIRTLPGLAKRVITLNSFSKNFLMTGWRVGAIIAEPELLRAMNDVNNCLIYTAPSISQRQPSRRCLFVRTSARIMYPPIGTAFFTRRTASKKFPISAWYAPRVPSTCSPELRKRG